MKKEVDEPLRIYIAGPYCPRTGSLHDASRASQHNTDKAIEIGNKLIEKGHFVFVPHLSHYIHTHYSCRIDYAYWWYEEDLTFLRLWANALYFISPSPGADMELKLAKKRGYIIFYHMDEVPTCEKGQLMLGKVSTEDIGVMDHSHFLNSDIQKKIVLDKKKKEGGGGIERKCQSQK